MKFLNVQSHRIHALILLTVFCWIFYPTYSQDIPELDVQVLSYKKDSAAIKITPDLLMLQDEYLKFRETATSEFSSSNRLLSIMDNQVRIEAISKSKDTKGLIRDLRQLGLNEIVDYQYIINGWLPISAIRAMNELEGLQFVRPAYQGVLQTGSVNSQGDSSMRSNIVRINEGLTGDGFLVGVLSDSYDRRNGAAADIASGDLPAAGVLVLQESTTGKDTTDEGRAMLQIIHDVAPGADLAFHTAIGGLATFAQGIHDLASNGCDIIVDDITYFGEAFFQDDIIAQAVDSVNGDGVVYLSSAGNQSAQSYVEHFVETDTVTVMGIDGLTYTIHDFDIAQSGSPILYIDILQSITIPDDGKITLILQWREPSASISGPPGCQSDLDLFLWDAAGTNLLKKSINNNINADPFEILFYENNTGGSADFNIMIGHFQGPYPDTLKWIILGDLDSVNDFDSESSTCYGHHNAAGAIAVGAAPWYATPAYGTDPPILESFSSRGGTPIFFNTDGDSIATIYRNKPDITAPDGGNNTFFGSDIWNDPDTSPNFFGTSAAAPHAAGVVALLLEAVPLAFPDEILLSLQNTAIDIPPVGFDYDSGWGLIKADAALAELITVVDVELVYFNANRINREDVLLNWQTAIEEDASHFEIERSDDGRDWKYIDEVMAFGTSDAINDYEYIERDVLDDLAGVYNCYYRLKMVDLDGSFEYSPIKNIRFEETDEDFRVLIFPNPSSTGLTVQFNADLAEEVDLILRDVYGRILFAENVSGTSGSSYYIPFATYKIPSGTYMLQVRSNKSERIFKKVVVQRY